MFNLALIIGLYAYGIFFLGLLGKINLATIVSLTIPFLILFFFYLRKIIVQIINGVMNSSPKERVVLVLLFLLVGVNIVGAIGPELAFDALWYHLTIPKEFILLHRIFYIKGGLLYYSAMPMLTEVLYIPALLLGNEIAAKLIHFSFGVLTCVALYKLSRLFINKYYSLISVLIFYSNLVIGWLSITAFADLSRTFFEVLSLYLFAKFYKSGEKSLLYKSGIILSFAIGAKLLSITSVFIYVVILLCLLNNKKIKAQDIILFIGITILIASPWFLFAYLSTGNPFFPLMSAYYVPPITTHLLSPVYMMKSFINVFLFSPDPLSPLYMILIPLFAVNIKTLYKKYKIVVIYCVVSLFIWYITPQTGGGRFISAYLPAYSFLAAAIIASTQKNLQRILITVVFLIALITICYRGVANFKFLPVIVGHITKEQFLLHNLNFEFGDFYDESGQIRRIVKNDRVLLIGLHNLYYIDFPHDDLSWGGYSQHKYILVQNGTLPNKYLKNYEEIYRNNRTHVKLYKLNEKDN